MPAPEAGVIVRCMGKIRGNKVLRELRESLGMSGIEFAQAVGIGNVALSNLERGYHLIAAETALKIVDRFGDELARLGYDLEDLLRSGCDQADR